MKHSFLILTAACLLFSDNIFAQHCTNDARYTEVSVFDSSEITVAANVQYGIAQDVNANPDTLLMDLYYPNLTLDTAALRPFVLLFHGGGFSSGDKQSGDIRDLCVHLALRGFVCASVNYRLGHDFSEYGQYKARYRAIQDGHAALRYAVNYANNVRIDTNWLFVGGQSAGSLIALGMVYADPVELDSIGLQYNSTATSVELGNLYTSGNTLTNTYTIKGIFNNWGGVTATEMDVDEMIPTIAFHGELDTTVRIDADPSFAHYTLNGSRAIHSELQANQICSELTVDTLGGHGIFRNASARFRAQRASCFFKSIFCGNCASLYTTDSIPPTCSIPLNQDPSAGPVMPKVYPNPVGDAFQLTGVVGTADIVIYNSRGQQVYQGTVWDGFVEVDLAPGIYFVKVSQASTAQPATVRFMKL